MPNTLFHRYRLWSSSKALAHSELLESEARYRELVEGTPDGIYIHSDDRIVYVNRAALDQLGATSADQIVGRSRLDFIHPDDRAESRSRVRDIYGGLRTPRINQRYLRLDGSVFYGETVATLITYLGKPAVLVFVRDVTDRQRVQEMLNPHARRHGYGARPDLPGGPRDAAIRGRQRGGVPDARLHAGRDDAARSGGRHRRLRCRGVSPRVQHPRARSRSACRNRRRAIARSAARTAACFRSRSAVR